MRRSITILGAACAALVATVPGVARADSLLYAKDGQIWIAHSDGSAARQITTTTNNWAWPSMADDGTVYAAGGLTRVNSDGSDSDGSDSIYHFDQSNNQLDAPVETYGSRSTPACPTYAPWNLRVAPNGSRVAYNLFFCDNMDSFYGAADSNQYTTLISENYEVSNWLDPGHILITHEGDTFGNAAFAEYDIMDPSSSHGPSDDPYLPDYEAASSRSANRVAVYEDDPLIDGSGVASADIRIYATNNGDVTDVTEKCTITLDASTAAASIVGASPTFTPDGSQLAWGAKDGIHHANTSNLDDCASVKDEGVLVAGAMQPFFGPVDEQAVATKPSAPTSGTTSTSSSGGGGGGTVPVAVHLASPTKTAKLSRKGTFTVKVSASKAGAVTVAGKIRLGRRTLKLKGRSTTVQAGRAKAITLSLSKADVRRLRAALRKHAKVTAKLTVAMAGVTPVALTIRIR